MAKRLNRVLNLVMGSFTGVFLGHGAYVWWDYRQPPGLYEMQSAPWYASILLSGILTLLVLAVCVLGKILLRKRDSAHRRPGGQF